MSRRIARFFKNKSYCMFACLPLFFVGCASVPRAALNPNGVNAVVPRSAIENSYANAQNNTVIPREKSATDWVIMDPPLRSPRVTFADSISGEDITKAWTQLSNREILKLLSNTRTEISVGKFNKNGTINYLVANATAEVGSYRVIMDYTPYLVEDAIDPSDNKKIGDARVGLGLRLTANITTYEAGVNLGSLMALGAAARLNQVQGSMHVDTIGIRLNNFGGTILSSTTIDETSILKAVEALAVIQSKIADIDTHLDPQVIWVKPISEFYNADKVAEQMNKKD